MKEEKDECQDFKKAFCELFINFRILKFKSTINSFVDYVEILALLNFLNKVNVTIQIKVRKRICNYCTI